MSAPEMDGRGIACDVVLPREAAAEESARLLGWLVENGRAVARGQPIAEFETSKSVFEVDSPCDGFLFRLQEEGQEVQVGQRFALVSATPQRPASPPPSPDALRSAAAEGPVVTQRARELLALHGLGPEAFSGLAVVREADVRSLLAGRIAGPTPAAGPIPAAGPALPDLLDEVLQTPELQTLRRLCGALRGRMRARFDRHVPTGTLLSDRWELARSLGFGEGSSVYDECLVLGDVRLGRDCWVGPYTVLDGAHAPLRIGDHSSIGSGSQIYTHDTIERALTGGRAPVAGRPTTIGACCFLAPFVVVGPGTKLGDHCFVATGSYVAGSFPECSFIAGNPARRVGRVELHGDRARLVRER